MKEEGEGNSSKLVKQAKDLFVALNEVYKILKEEAASEEVVKKNEMRENETKCFHQWDFDYPVIVLAPLGLFCLLLMTLVARRNQVLRKTCDGNIDVLVPLDVLTSYRHRTRYVVATTLIVYPCYQLLMAVAFPELSTTFLFAIARVAKIITFGTVIYPIFVAINQKSLLSSALGCLISLVVLATSIIPLQICFDYLDAFASEIFARLPMMVCATLMALIFMYDCVQCFRRGEYLYHANDETFEDFARGKLQYVRELLQKRPESPAYGEEGLLGRFIRQKKERLLRLYKGHPGFKYPTRVLCMYVSLLVLMYYLIYQAVLFERETIGGIDNVVHNRVISRLNRSWSAADFFSEIASEGELSLHTTDDYLQFLSHALTMLEVSFYVSVAISAVVHLLMLLSMMLNYRDNVIRSYRGDFHHIMPPNKMRPATIVVGFTRYCGYQISFITYSFVIQAFTYAVLLFVIVQMAVLPIIYGYHTPLLAVILPLWPTVLIASVLFLSQIVVTRVVFVAVRGRRFEIKRRNAFFIWSYYLFLINALIGMFACLLRILKAAGIAFVSMGRLDWCHLPGKFVNLDPGYLSYVGQVHVDALHSNPIVLSFAHHLRLSHSSHRNGSAKQAEADPEAELQELVLSKSPDHLRPTRRAVRRWFVAYTVLKNPALRHLRKSSSRLIRRGSEHCAAMAACCDNACDNNASA